MAETPKLQRIAVVRRKLGMTQETLAAILETQQSRISKIESDDQPATVQDLNEIAIALGVPMIDLIAGDRPTDRAMAIARAFDSLSRKEQRALDGLVDGFLGEAGEEAPGAPRPSGSR